MTTGKEIIKTQGEDVEHVQVFKSSFSSPILLIDNLNTVANAALSDCHLTYNTVLTPYHIRYMPGFLWTR